ncbi:hypothetical protein [Actinoplanes sp. NPDC020271]|uniref:hypothetical protein n=1 Tax=Actinoplanes sp. NPDC020271 TaxID=3363896 RepID=UPI0037B8F717
MSRPPAWNATVPRQLLWFMLVGALSTVLQTIVYVSVREVLAATWASWLALLVVTPANTEAHRRITFNVTTTAIGRLHWEAGLTSVVVYLANLAAGPWFAGFAGPHPSALTESMTLALTGSIIGGLRYVILRGWVFAARRHTLPDSPEPAVVAPVSSAVPAGDSSSAEGAALGRRTRRNALRGRALRARPNAAPASASATPAAPIFTSATPAAPILASATPAATGLAPALLEEPAAATEASILASAFPVYPSTGNITAALACLGTLAPIPTARLCTGQSNSGVLNQRPAGRLRTWHRNRRQHLTARS